MTKSRRNSYLLRVYGITEDEYDEILLSQGGACAICGKSPAEEGRYLAVEHDHVSRVIRGICCMYCNRYVIGRHRNGELLRRLADYVERDTGYKVPIKKRKNRGRRKKAS